MDGLFHFSVKSRLIADVEIVLYVIVLTESDGSERKVTDDELHFYYYYYGIISSTAY